MKGKGIIITVLVVALIFGIIFGGEYIFVKSLPPPKTSGFYEDGAYAEYGVKWDDYGIDRPGKLYFRVMGNTLLVNLTLYYDPPVTVLVNEVIFNISGDDIYYHGEKVFLPFFYGGGKVISYYNGSYINVSRTDNYSMYPFNTHGLIQYRYQIEVDTYSHIKTPDGKITEGEYNSYHYGMVSRLLFFTICPSFDPVINGLLAKNKHFMFLLGLHKTNIPLGPVDYFAIAQIYLFMLGPILLVLVVPAFVIVLYRYLKERNG